MRTRLSSESPHFSRVNEDHVIRRKVIMSGRMGRVPAWKRLWVRGRRGVIVTPVSGPLVLVRLVATFFTLWKLTYLLAFRTHRRKHS